VQEKTLADGGMKPASPRLIAPSPPSRCRGLEADPDHERARTRCGGRPRSLAGRVADRAIQVIFYPHEASAAEKLDVSPDSPP